MYSLVHHKPFISEHFLFESLSNNIRVFSASLSLVVKSLEANVAQEQYPWIV